MEQTPKPSLLAQYAKRKAEAKKSRKGSSYFESGSHSRFARPTSDKPGAFRGGRNGQGKPC